MTLYFALAFSISIIGIAWLIRKMLRQNLIANVKDILAVLGAVSCLGWGLPRVFGLSTTSEAPASAFLASIPWGWIWIIDSVLLAVYFYIFRNRKG